MHMRNQGVLCTSKFNFFLVAVVATIPLSPLAFKESILEVVRIYRTGATGTLMPELVHGGMVRRRTYIDLTSFL